MKRAFRAAAAAFLTCIFAAGSSVGVLKAAAEANEPSAATAAAMAEDYYHIDDKDMNMTTFSEYYDLHSADVRPDDEIFIKGSSFVSAENGDISAGSFTDSSGDTRKDTLLWNSLSGEVTYDFEVAESGVYCLEASYCPMISSSSSIELKVEIDGEIPYDTASSLYLSQVWVNEKDIYTDSRGNQVRPTQVQTEMWQKCFFGDRNGLFSEPLFFALEKGEHTLKLSSERAKLAIESLCFRNPEKLPSYSEYKASV